MSVIMVGANNQIAMAAPGRPMLAAPLPGTPVAISPFSAAGGLTGWWDAGVPSGILDPTGTALKAFGSLATAVADKSGAGMPLTVWHAANSNTNPPIATPRLNGLLGGLG